MLHHHAGATRREEVEDILFDVASSSRIDLEDWAAFFGREELAQQVGGWRLWRVGVVRLVVVAGG
jgi:hypothetical protein